MPGAHCCTLATWNKGNKFSVGLAHLLLGRREFSVGLAHLLLGWKEFSVELAYLFLGRRESERWTLLITWSSHEAEGGVPGSTG